MIYKIIVGASYQALENNVNQWFREHPGWALQGGPCVDTHDTHGIYFQAVVNKQ